MTRSVLLIVSIDTEEDNWQPRRDGVTVENVRELPRLDGLLQRLGARATYFVTYQVAIDKGAAATLRELRGAGAEIGAHLHPWNTPPLDEPFLPRNSMLKNLPAALQQAKLERLTDAVRHAVGTAPVSFRAGRYALGPAAVTALRRCGYRIDSSVTPYVSWEAFDDGASFVGAPLEPYGLREDGDVRVPDPDGALLEIPMSIGYNRAPFDTWDRVRRTLAARPLRPFRLAGLAARTGLLRRIFLSPERQDVGDMLTLSRRLLEQGLTYLQLFFHSGSLVPGLSPYSPDRAAVDRLYARTQEYLERVARIAPVTCATLSEAGARLRPPVAVDRPIAASR